MSTDSALRVVVLAGGPSHERDVSVRSGRRISEALRNRGVDVDERDMNIDLLPSLIADPPDCIFPMFHGAAGEDGAAAAVAVGEVDGMDEKPAKRPTRDGK